MQTNRLTVLGPPEQVSAFAGRHVEPASFRHIELLENAPGRYALQFESVTDPLAYLQRWSRRKPGLTFLLEYEREGVKGLARLRQGRLIRHEITC